MNLDEFFSEKRVIKYNHKWLPFNDIIYNYMCDKCEKRSELAFTGPSCSLSDEEAIIKKLLE